MFGRNQTAAGLQRAGQRAKQMRFFARHNPEYAELVVPTLCDPVVAGACQHLFDMPEAIGLSSPVHCRKQLLRQGSGINYARCFQAVVAVSASLRRVFAKVAQQQRSAAAGGLDQLGHRVNPLALALAARFFHLAYPMAGPSKIVRCPQQERDRGIAIAPGAAGFLVIGLDRLRHAGMGDKSHIGLVDPHSKGDRCDHHHVFAGNESGLVGGADLGRKACVIG